MNAKGISPLIAAVILIAFVIAIAAVASGFFSGFIKGRVSEVETSGAQTVDCSVANLDIDSDTVTVNDNYSVANANISFTALIKGETTLKNFTVTVYTGKTTSLVSFPPVGSKSPGESAFFQNTSSGLNGSEITKIKLTSVDCPTLESTVNRTSISYTSGETTISGTSWDLIY